MRIFLERYGVILELLGSMRARYLLLYFFAGLSAVLETVSIGLVLPLIEILTRGTPSMGLPGIAELIVGWLGGFSLLEITGVLFIVFTVKNLLKLLAHYGNSKIVEEMRGVWMTTLFDKYSQQHYLFFVSAKHGELMYNMFDLCQRAMYGLRQPVGLFLHGFALVLTLLFLASISWQFTLGSVLVLGLGYGFVHRPMLARSSALGKVVLANYHAASALASEVFRGIREVKAYDAATALVRQYRAIVSRMVKGSVRIAFLEVTPTVMPEMLLALLLFLAVAIFGSRYSEEGISMLLPVIGAFSYGLYRLFVQGSSVARAGIAFASHWASIDRLARELHDQGYPDIAGGLKSDIVPADELVCEGVSFAYEEHEALRNVSLKFRRGSITAIVGDSGAGKSTLTDLLTRLLEPDAGAITYGGEDIREYTLATWRKTVALVSQDPFLFHGTIRENLLLGFSQSVSDDRVWDALHLSGAAKFVSKLSNKLNAVVGERGVKLSGGQRQRIAIARALVHDPHVLLLDEVTSALDVKTELALLRTLDTLKRQLIIIAITHRPVIAQRSDFVYVLRDGVVAEAGTFDQVAFGEHS